jgi:hypothetical protein
VYKLWSSSLCSFLQPPVTSYCHLLVFCNLSLQKLWTLKYWNLRAFSVKM